MFDNDHIQRFIFDGKQIRGQIIQLDKVLEKIFDGHDYPAVIKAQLTECLLCAVLMSSTLKYEGQLTIQFQSDKALSLLLIKCNHLHQVRALAQFEPGKDEENYIKAMEGGSLIVTIEPDKKVKPYQSIVPFKDNIQASIEHYFQQSEQLLTCFFLTAHEPRAAGILLQQMPTNSDEEHATQQVYWQHLVTVAETMTEQEFLTLENAEILYRLFHQDECRLFAAHQVQFACPCSKARMLESVRLLGEEDAMALLSIHKVINVQCDFCMENYAFETHDVTYLFRSQ